MNKKSILSDCIVCDDNLKYNIDEQVVLKIHDIDDLAVVWIAIEKDNKIVLHNIEEDNEGKIVPRKDTKWLWRPGGRHGDGEVNITQWILNHQNDILCDKTQFYLVMAIYDFPYEKFVSAGKWSYDASLEVNYNAIWHKHDFGKSDVKNKRYGLKYLKIFKFKIKKRDKDKNELSISEVVPKTVASNIEHEIKTNHNYTSQKNFINNVSTEYKPPLIEEPKKEISFIFFIESIFVLGLYIFGILRGDIILSNINKLLYKDFNLIHYFIFYNIILLLYFFFRYKLGGRAWELVLKKKHNKELDTFMVVLGLLFSAAFGSITSFSFDGEKLNNCLYILGIFSLYVTTNLILLCILTVISTYVVNTLSANKIMVFILIFFVGIGIFIQEVIDFADNYKPTTKTSYCKWETE